MAVIALRPSADKVKGHTPKSGNQCFPMVNEATFDNDATYIYQNISSSANANASSTLTLPKTNLPQGSFNVVSCTLHIQAKASDYGECSGTCQVLPDGANNNMRIGDRAYLETVISNPIQSIIGKTYTKKTFPSLQVKLGTSGSLTNTKDPAFQIRISQVYLEITYETPKPPKPVGTGVYLNLQTVWTEVKEVYLKQNGKWILQQQNQILPLIKDKKFVRK